MSASPPSSLLPISPKAALQILHGRVVGNNFHVLPDIQTGGVRIIHRRLVDRMLWKLSRRLRRGILKNLFNFGEIKRSLALSHSCRRSWRDRFNRRREEPYAYTRTLTRDASSVRNSVCSFGLCAQATGMSLSVGCAAR